MKCPECVKLGAKSLVYPGICSSTLMYCPPYYDEEGNLHIHDGNITTCQYSCSNGHKWSEVVPNKPCPTCGK